MTHTLHLAIVGDRDDTITAHRAIPVALADAARTAGREITVDWVPTEEITSVARIAAFDGLWAAPGTPYRSLEGALLAIRHARSSGVPLLGTCGGFQHAVLEYARHVLGWTDAMHAESDPGVGRPVIAALDCALVEAHGLVDLAPGSRIAAACDALSTQATYRCRYGLNPAFRVALEGGALHVTGEDEAGDARAIELDGHPFFIATLWQPERAALAGERVPLAEAFVAAAAAHAATTR